MDLPVESVLTVLRSISLPLSHSFSPFVPRFSSLSRKLVPANAKLSSSPMVFRGTRETPLSAVSFDLHFLPRPWMTINPSEPPAFLSHCSHIVRKLILRQGSLAIRMRFGNNPGISCESECTKKQRQIGIDHREMRALLIRSMCAYTRVYTSSHSPT